MAAPDTPADSYVVQPFVMAELVASAMGPAPSGSGLLIGRVAETTSRTVTDAEHATVTTSRRVIVELLAASPWAGHETAAEPWRRPLFDAVGRPDLTAWRASLEQSGVTADEARSDGGLCIVGMWTVRSGTPGTPSLREHAAIRHAAVLGCLASGLDSGLVTASEALSSSWCSPWTLEAAATVGLERPGSPAAALASLPLPFAWGCSGAAVSPGPLLLVVGADGEAPLDSSVPAAGADNHGRPATLRCWYRSWLCPFGAAALRRELAELESTAPQLLAAGDGFSADEEEEEEAAGPEEAGAAATGAKAGTDEAGAADDKASDEATAAANASDDKDTDEAKAAGPAEEADEAKAAGPAEEADAAKAAGPAEEADAGSRTAASSQAASPAGSVGGAEDGAPSAASSEASSVDIPGVESAWASILFHELEPEAVPTGVYAPAAPMATSGVASVPAAADSEADAVLTASHAAVAAALASLRTVEDTAMEALGTLAKAEADGAVVGII